jgi:hypothetical protein
MRSFWKMPNLISIATIFAIITFALQYAWQQNSQMDMEPPVVYRQIDMTPLWQKGLITEDFLRAGKSKEEQRPLWLDLRAGEEFLHICMLFFFSPPVYFFSFHRFELYAFCSSYSSRMQAKPSYAVESQRSSRPHTNLMARLPARRPSS